MARQSAKDFSRKSFIARQYKFLKRYENHFNDRRTHIRDDALALAIEHARDDWPGVSNYLATHSGYRTARKANFKRCWLVAFGIIGTGFAAGFCGASFANREWGTVPGSIGFIVAALSLASIVRGYAPIWSQAIIVVLSGLTALFQQQTRFGGFPTDLEFTVEAKIALIAIILQGVLSFIFQRLVAVREAQEDGIARDFVLDIFSSVNARCHQEYVEFCTYHPGLEN